MISDPEPSSIIITESGVLLFEASIMTATFPPQFCIFLDLVTKEQEPLCARMNGDMSISGSFSRLIYDLNGRHASSLPISYWIVPIIIVP